MLKRFSSRRVIGLFTIDLVGTLAMLALAAVLRAEIGPLSPRLNVLLETLDIQTFLFWSDINPGALVPWQVYVLVAIIWPFFFISFSVYDGKRSPTPVSYTHLTLPTTPYV